MNVSSELFGETSWLKIRSKITFHINRYQWIAEILLESTDLINKRTFSSKWMKCLSKSR